MKSTHKRFISLALTVVMLFGLVGTAGFPAHAEDACGYSPAMTMSALMESETDAEAGSSYCITTRDELISFAAYVNSGRSTVGATFYLKSDIDLADAVWTPIGDKAAVAFEGVFDGCGYAALNLTNNEADSDFALFGNVAGKSTVIKNLGVEGKINGKASCAGIAANLTDATIANCWNAVDVTGTNTVGGIAGTVKDAVITNCCSFGYIKGNSNVGAIAGDLNGSCVVEYSYYVYYCADMAVGNVSNASSVTVYRFSTSSTEILAEKKLTVHKDASDDLITLLNDWLKLQDRDDNFREWVYDMTETGRERTDGRYPSQKYPDYFNAVASFYTPTASVSQLWDLQTSASVGGYYSISSAKELYTFADYVNAGFSTVGATFFLTSDIVIGTGVSSITNLFWEPIGNDNDIPFCGTFDGQGYIINGTILDGVDDLGLFGFVDDQTSVIKNVGVSSIITGNDNLGGIVANLINGTIYNCWYDGSITGDDHVGGIVGNIENGKVYNCVNYASIVGSNRVGGILGDSTTASIVKYCYYADNTANGLGDNDCTSTAVLTFSENGDDFTLERSVAVGASVSVKLLNALNSWVNSVAPDNTSRNWKIDTSAESLVRVGGKHPTHLFPGDNSGLKRVDEPFVERDEEGNPYNVKYSETATMTALFNSAADGIPGGHYSISDGAELEMLAQYVNRGRPTANMVFYLKNEINIAPQCAATGGDGWMPIGRDANLTSPDTYLRSFKGIFDGCGYTVSNLLISKNEADDAGLFGHCDNAVIKNLGVVGNIIAENKVGGIAATVDDSQIINCWSAVNIQAEDRVGGICGRIFDTEIINCASYGYMLAYGGSASAVAGGVVGVATGDCNLSHCYYIESVLSQAYETVSDDTTVDALSFSYNYMSDEYVCQLENAAAIDETSTTNLLTALNAWVYHQNNGQYCAWYTSPILITVGDISAHFPRLMTPDLSESGENEDYNGDYEATSTITELYRMKTDGVEGCAYSINGLEDLESFRKYVNEGYKTRGIIFFMTRDIDMSTTYSADSGRSWTPIGNVNEPFTGTFDGQGYTIKYLYINTTAEDQGLFGHVSGDRTIIKNLGLCGSVLADNNAGGLVGDFNFATIANCWVACEVASLDGNAGGLVGGANGGTIVNCTNYGIVANGKAFGAIAGYAVGTEIDYCYYLYATTQSPYSRGSVVEEKGVEYFNGTSAACVMHEKVNVEGTETKNVLSALKLYVDAHPETNYCYWAIGNTEEYLKMGVTYFPVLISASNTMGGSVLNHILAYFNDKEYTSIVTAVNDANDAPNGGDVLLADNAVLYLKDDITLDSNVRLVTDQYSLVIKSNVSVASMQQLYGYFTVKEGGKIYLRDRSPAGFSLFMYANKNADASCNSTFYSTGSMFFRSSPVENGEPQSYNLSFEDGEFIVNSSLDSGNPHGIPPASKIEIQSHAVFNVCTNARIRTTGGAVIMDQGTVKIGNAVLDRNGGMKMVGVFEDDGGIVSLPFIYKDGYTLRGWSDGKQIFPAGSRVNVPKAGTVLTAQWTLGNSPDPYPGDDSYSEDVPIYNIPMTVIQSNGGTIAPDSLNAAKGENLTFQITTDVDHEVKTVLVDGAPVELDEDGCYKFVSISRPHTIVVLFGKQSNQAFYDWVCPFEDVSDGEWYYNNIRYAVSAEIFKGTTDTLFSPDDAMTREMMVTVLWRMAGCPMVPDTVEQTFSDVAKDSYAYDAIRWATMFGIVNGYGDGSFGYGDPILREQLVTMVFRYAKNYVGVDISEYDSTNILVFSDVLQISLGMSQAFQWAVGANILRGTSATTLEPKGLATRAQVAAVLSRFCATFMDTIPIVSA